MRCGLFEGINVQPRRIKLVASDWRKLCAAKLIAKPAITEATICFRDDKLVLTNGKQAGPRLLGCCDRRYPGVDPTIRARRRKSAKAAASAAAMITMESISFMVKEVADLFWNKCDAKIRAAIWLASCAFIFPHFSLGTASDGTSNYQNCYRNFFCVSAQFLFCVRKTPKSPIVYI